MGLRTDRIRGLLEERGWTLGELHIQARRHRPSLSWSTLSEVVNGKRRPSLAVVDALARAFGVPTDDILEIGIAAEESEIPIPEPNIRSLVSDLNQQPEPVRAKIAGVVSEILSLIRPPQSAGAVDPETLDRLLDTLSPTDEVDLQRELEARVAARKRGESGGRSGAKRPSARRREADKADRTGSNG